MRALSKAELTIVAGGNQVVTTQKTGEEVTIIHQPSLNELLLRDIIFLGIHLLLEVLASEWDDDDSWQRPCLDSYYC